VREVGQARRTEDQRQAHGGEGDDQAEAQTLGGQLGGFVPLAGDLAAAFPEREEHRLVLAEGHFDLE
jgi:hypothetical protein